MKRTVRMALAVVLILVLTVNAVLLAGRLFGRARIDMTEENIYTLSQGTRNILEGLNQPVHLRLYYSRTAAMKGPEDIRYYNSYYLYVRDLLEEYVSRSGGVLTLRTIDPRAYTEQEDEAVESGLRRFPLSEDESFFFGLVAATELGREEAIPFFEPGRQELVEYDISRVLVEVTRSSTERLGVLSSLPVVGAETSPYMRQMLQAQGRDPGRSWQIISQLRGQYEVVNVPREADSIDQTLDSLLVIHPKDLSERTLFAIDQYVMKGGRLVVFVDPHCLADRPPQQPGMMQPQNQDTSSELNALLRSWGVEMEPEAIAADRTFAVPAPLRPGGRPQTVLTYLDLDQRALSDEEPVTANLHAVQYLFGGVLRKAEGAEAAFEPLIQTSAEAGTWTPSDPFELQFLDPDTIRRGVEPAGEPLTLACRVSGKLKTNFPDGPPEGAGTGEDGEGGPEEPERAELVKQTADGAAVLVFADVDMITDPVAFQQTFFGTAEVGDNAALVMNALEWIGGGSNLIAIRSRGRYRRPFEVVDRIEMQTEQATASRVAALEAKIADYQQRLNQLQSPGPEQDQRLLQSEAIKERRRIQEEIREARKQLRDLNATRRERIEALKARLQFHNMVWAPAGVLLIAVVLAVVRRVKAARYAARRSE